MHKLKLKALQIPELLLNNVPVVFPYKKADALFYYIAIEKTSTRDVIASMLWENSTTESARKNLRHALYIIKKTLGFDPFSTNQKYTLSINENIDFQCDVHELTEQHNIAINYKEFLSGFYVKNSSSYEEWINQKRDFIRNHYLSKLYNSIINLSPDMVSEIEERYHQYIAIDPFDERVSLAMLKVYHVNKLYFKGINVYQDLHKELGDELGIVPGQEITNLYRKLRLEWTEASAEEHSEVQHLIKGRSKEAKLLKTSYHQFLNKKVKAVMIKGENGVGKTYLVDNLIDSISSDYVLHLSSSCYFPEKNTPLYPFNRLIFQIEDIIRTNNISILPAYSQVVAQYFPTFLGQSTSSASMSIDIENNFNFRAVQNGIYRILSVISEEAPILMVIDNFHYSDYYSRQLLLFLLKEMQENLMVIFTCLDTINHDMLQFISLLEKENLLTSIHLKHFSKEDTFDIITSTLNDTSLSMETLEKIYKETAGNAFFLNELLSTYDEDHLESKLSNSAMNILSERLQGLSLECLQLLDIISLFYDYATFKVIEHLLGKNSLDIIDNIEKLKVKSLIKEEVSHGIIKFYFTQNKMREFVQSQISPSKKKVLHNSIASALEDIGQKTIPNYYSQLVHHFTMASNTQKVLQYQIYPFEDISINMFELYPSQLNTSEIIRHENISDYFNTLEDDLVKACDTFIKQEDYDDLYARLLITKGRYFILSGLYTEGLKNINQLLSMTYVKKNPNYLLKSHRQMVYYSIQLCQFDMMTDYIEKGLDIANRVENHLELAIFNRLNGLRYMMSGDYINCEQSLWTSIELLETHNPKSTTNMVNIAAAINYLGEMYRYQKQFEKAISFFHQAIAICSENNLAINATFYTNLGRAYIGNKDKSTAYEYFYNASQLYDQSFTLMGRSITKGYCAIASCEANDFKQGIKYIKEAEYAVNQLSSPLEKGLFRRTQVELIKRFNSQLPNVFSETIDFYYEDCKRLLGPLHVYELEELNKYY